MSVFGAASGATASSTSSVRVVPDLPVWAKRASKRLFDESNGRVVWTALRLRDDERAPEQLDRIASLEDADLDQSVVFGSGPLAGAHRVFHALKLRRWRSRVNVRDWMRPRLRHQAGGYANISAGVSSTCGNARGPSAATPLRRLTSRYPSGPGPR